MNKQVGQILQLGIIFTIIVVFADVLLTQLPVLDWLALGVAFFFIAVAIIDSVTRLVPKEKHILASRSRKEDELEGLANLVDRAINRRENEALGLLSEKLRSIALSTLAARMRLSKNEIHQLAENDPNSILVIVKDEQMVSLLAGNAPILEVADSRQVDELLSKIEGWSR